MPTTTIQKFSPDSPILVELRDSHRADQNALHGLDGAKVDESTALRLTALRTSMEAIGDKTAASGLLQATAPQVRELLRERLASSDVAEADRAAAFIDSVLGANGEIKAETQAWIKKVEIPTRRREGRPVPNGRDEVVAALVERLPDPLFEKFVSAYASLIHTRREHLLQNAPTWGQEYAALVGSAVQQGRLPEAALRAEKVIQGLEFRVVDGLFWGHPGFRNAAIFSRASQIASLHALNPSSADFRRAFNHELTHAISGRTEQFRLVDGEIAARRGSRLGLDFSGLDLDAGRSTGSRFGWLNEAITERINLQLLGGAESASYVVERAILARLMQRVPEATFYQAYFEHYEPDQPRAEGLPGWAALSSAIAGAYEPGFLATLDKCVDMHAPKRALALLGEGVEAVKRSAAIRRIKLAFK